MTRLTSCPDPETVAARAAAHVLRTLASARREARVAHLALSGGTTPIRTYELLAAAPSGLHDTEVWFADERCVGPREQESNYRAAAETLLGPAGFAAERVHRMQGELGPREGARRYALELLAGIERVEDALPSLDLIVLGMGPDGHVASLFPGARTLKAGRELCLGVWDSPKPPAERITLSLAVLRAARSCLLLATGAGKADAVSAMLAEPTAEVPASLLRRERLTVIVDDAASPTPPAGAAAGARARRRR